MRSVAYPNPNPNPNLNPNPDPNPNPILIPNPNPNPNRNPNPNPNPNQVTKKSWALGVASGLMIILGYPGELILEGPALAARFMFWMMAMFPFGYVSSF